MEKIENLGGNMKVGDYVRTINGEIYKIDDNFALKYFQEEQERGIPEHQIIKSSPNIIDLIEVGDYVNGRKVYQIGYNAYDDFVLKMSIDKNGNPDNYEDFIYDDEIKSIVTKEQFSQMEYKVGE